MISTLISIGLCLPSVVISHATPQAAPIPQSTDSADLAETTQDVDALRTLLTKEVQSALDRKSSATGAPSNASKRAAKKQGSAKDQGAERDPDAKSGEEAGGADQGNASLFGLGSANTRSANSLMVAIQGARHAALSNSLWRGVRSATSFTRGFYCPGVGVWIDTTVSLPVVYDSVKEGAKVEGRASEDDAWNQALSEASGTAPVLTRTLVAGTVLESHFDPANCEAVIDAVKGLLVRYGKRVRHLSDDESVVIALKLEGDSSGIYSQPLTIVEEDDLTVDESGDTVLKPGVPGYAKAVIAPPKPKTVVLRVKSEHLAAHAAGEIDDAALSKRIQITEY